MPVPVTHPEQHYRWTWDLAAPPDALWPLVSNTDRFNRDCGYPAVTVIRTVENANGRGDTRRLRATVMGRAVEWDEHAFEWIAPHRFGVERIFRGGPLARFTMACELAARPDGGTRLIYVVRATPSGVLGRLALPFAIGRRARALTERVLRQYDVFAQRGWRTSLLAQKPILAEGGLERLERICQRLAGEARQPAPLVAKLREFVTTADDLSLARLRPYAVANEWRESRREILHLFLHAARAGLLDFSWDLVCPHCRGAKPGPPSLSGISAHAHCDSCNVDFEANFDQSVELTFMPNASVRRVVRSDYCVGGPQVTPHIVAQQRLAPGEGRALPLALTPGRYRVRTRLLATQHAFRVDRGGAKQIRVEFGTVPAGEPELAPAGELTLVNATDAPHLAIVEHLAWTDQATTAAEVTALQLFRDLFSREVLRAGERISVGAVTVVFTDLKNSTQLYQEIGDAPAFGRVLTHFEILKAAVAAENGAVVKTMGDAIMAVFSRPVAALRAMLHAQRWLAHPEQFTLPAGVAVPPSSLSPLALKAGLHCGPCLAINQNERLDYFGTTVNLTARLCSLCTGTDLVLSATMLDDLEVSTHLRMAANLRRTDETAVLKGFGGASFAICRVKQ